MVNLSGTAGSLWIFFVMSFAVFGASEIFKAWVNAHDFKPRFKVGITMAILMGILFTLGLGRGIVQGITGIEYTSVLIPYLFMGIDILCTGTLISIGSKALSMKFEKNGIDISGSLEKKFRDGLGYKSDKSNGYEVHQSKTIKDRSNIDDMKTKLSDSKE